MTRYPGSRRLAGFAGLIGVVVWLPGTVAQAQAPSPETRIEAPADSGTQAQAAQPIPLEDVAYRAEATRAELDAIHPRDASRQALERIGSELDRALPEVEARLAKTRKALAARPNVRTLQQLKAELTEIRERLQPWDEELDLQLAGLHAARKRLDAIAERWESTDEVARREGEVGATVTRIAAVNGKIDHSYVQEHSALEASQLQRFGFA